MERMSNEQVMQALRVDGNNALLRAVNELLTRYEEEAATTAANEDEKKKVRLGALTRMDACRHVRQSLHQWRDLAMKEDELSV